MEAERFGRLQAIFDAVAELPADQRRHAIAELCPGEPELESELVSLLAAEEGASDFLAGFSAAVVASPLSLLGRQLGPYRVEQKLAEGGMSTLYVGVRTDLAYQQRVAVKVFGFSPDRADLLQRFQVERQILASLKHPAIARLLDGGATEEGLPYLVMELIDGVPVDRYCAERRLTTDQRIDLFLDICAAVAYAHRNLVVHRDLKPSNILVDGEGQPKLLDFGIAKLLVGAEETRTDERLMTPQYASPEQVTGGAITTATDVYALGVLLYGLLAVRSPYRFSPERPGELERAIVERPPEPPSQAAPPRLRRVLRGDLDNIVLAALRKEPAERYRSVDFLAEDLRRYRQGLPVSALPATPGYRLRKFVGRYPVAVATWSGALLVILGLAVSMTFQSVRLRRERDRAVEVTGFLGDIFRNADVEQRPGREVTARELLDRGRAKLTAELAGQPETEAALDLTIGKAYRSLALYDSAAPLLERALALRRRTLGEDRPEVAECLDDLAYLYLERDQVAKAETAAREALAIRRRRGGEADPDLSVTLNELALVLAAKGDFAGAEVHLEEALRVHRARFGRAQKENVPLLTNLAQMKRQRGDLAAAGRLYREAIVIARREYGPAHPWTSRVLSSLGVLLTQQGDLAGAEAADREALAVAHRAYGEEHPAIAWLLNDLASVLIDRGRWQEAEGLYRKALAMQRKFDGNDRLPVAVTLNNLADLLSLRGDGNAAMPLQKEALRIVRKLFGGEEHPEVADQLAHLSKLLARQGDLEAALPPAEEALAIRRKVFGERHPSYAASLVALGALRLAQGSPAAAEPLLRQGVSILRTALPPGHTDTAAAESQLGSCLAARGRSDEAEPLLRTGYRTLLRAFGPADPRTVAARERLNALSRPTGRPSGSDQPGR